MKTATLNPIYDPLTAMLFEDVVIKDEDAYELVGDPSGEFSILRDGNLVSLTDELNRILKKQRLDVVMNVVIDLGRAIANWVKFHRPNANELSLAETAAKSVLHSLHFGFTTTHFGGSVAFHIRRIENKYPEKFADCVDVLIETAVSAVTNPRHVDCEVKFDQDSGYVRIWF